jgi:hypothetical protein
MSHEVDTICRTQFAGRKDPIQHQFTTPENEQRSVVRVAHFVGSELAVMT